MAKFTVEIEFDVSGVYEPGAPARPPSYSHGGLPPEPDHVEVEDLVSVGYVTLNPQGSEPRWATVPIPLSMPVRELLLEAIMADPHLRELAQDAIVEEALP